MATQVQLRRGTEAEQDLFTGAEGELTYSTDSKGLRIHDGATMGGFMVDVVVAFQRPTAENNYTWYRKYASGWVEQGGRAARNETITLPITMANTEYGALAGFCVTQDDNISYSINVAAKTTTTIKLKSESTVSSNEAYWRVEGMAATTSSSTSSDAPDVPAGDDVIIE